MVGINNVDAGVSAHGGVKAAHALTESISTEGRVEVPGGIPKKRTITDRGIVGAVGIGKQANIPTAVLK